MSVTAEQPVWLRRVTQPGIAVFALMFALESLSRSTLAGSILDNTPENLARWIQDPDKVKPGANMPTLGLKGKDLNDLVAYLESLK